MPLPLILINLITVTLLIEAEKLREYLSHVCVSVRTHQHCQGIGADEMGTCSESVNKHDNVMLHHLACLYYIEIFIFKLSS